VPTLFVCARLSWEFASKGLTRGFNLAASEKGLTARRSDYWELFVRECRRLNAPLYARFAEGIRDDPELQALAALAKRSQPMANILLGSVHYLLLRGAASSLRAFYPSLGIPNGAGDPFPHFRAFCLERREELAPLIAAGVTNTNEIGRSAFLHAGFSVLADQAEEPLHLIELGPSAGLNLLWDRYAFRFLYRGETLDIGARDAMNVLDIPVTGKRPPSGIPPKVGMRIGLENHPVDLKIDCDRDWLRALVWPDHTARMARLEAGLAALAEEPPEIRSGDALDNLMAAIAEAPREGTVCVFHTMVTYQFAPLEREALNAILTVAGLRRPVWRLSLEWDDERYPLLLTRYREGTRTERCLGFCNSHGEAMEWLGG
jgi:hypothetical protein